MDFKERFKELLRDMHEAQWDGAIPIMIAESLLEFDQANGTPWEKSATKWTIWNLQDKTNQKAPTEKTADQYKNELTSEIWDFLEKHNITKLEAYDVDPCGAPTVFEDPSDMHDDFTLDRLVVDKQYGYITVEGSNTFSNDEWKLDDLCVDTVEELRNWLREHYGTIVRLADEK